MIKLSIIILSYNTQELLQKCLESIFVSFKVSKFQSFKDFLTEVIVVDNGSTDGSVGVVQNAILRLRSGQERKTQNDNLKFKIIENKENLGFAKGNNIGLKEARGKYILFLNSDTEVFPGCLDEAVTFMEKNKDVGALTAKTMLSSGKMDPDCHRGFPTPWASLTYFLGLEKLFPQSKLFGQYHKLYLNLNENHEIDAGAGAFMMIRKEIIKKVGMWDESYFFYGEDLDYYYRIKKSGYKVMFYAQPLLMHHKGASSGLRKESKEIARVSKGTRLRVAKASIEAMEIFYKKFYKNKYPRWLTFLVLTAIRLKGFFRIIKHYFT